MFERALISERVNASLEAARNRGRIGNGWSPPTDQRST